VGNLTKLRSLYLSGNQIEDLTPLANLRQLWSLYLANNQIQDITPLGQLKTLDSLDLRGNRISDLAPLRGLTEWKYLSLDNNKITDVSVLVEMGKADREDAPSFSLFWRIDLSGNPLSDPAQIDKLREVAKSVVFDERDE
jgi:internalin A